MVGNIQDAKNAEEVACASMVDDVQNAKNAEEVACASMVGNVQSAKNVEEVTFANMVGNVQDAKKAEEVACANMVQNAKFVQSANIERKEWTVQIAIWKLRIKRLRGWNNPCLSTSACVQKFTEAKGKNNIPSSEHHKTAAFGFHASGIIADFYDDGGILRKNVGTPPPILGYIITCDVEKLEALSSGYVLTYHIGI